MVHLFPLICTVSWATSLTSIKLEVLFSAFLKLPLCLFIYVFLGCQKHTIKSPDLPTSSIKTQDVAAKEPHHSVWQPPLPVKYCNFMKWFCILWYCKVLNEFGVASQGTWILRTGYASPVMVCNCAPKTTLKIHFNISSFVLQYTKLLPEAQD